MSLVFFFKINVTDDRSSVTLHKIDMFLILVSTVSIIK